MITPIFSVVEGLFLLVIEVIFVVWEDIKAFVEDYSNKMTQMSQLQKRLITLAGRDPEQEIYIGQRLESLERYSELLDIAIFSEGILSDKEICALENRMDGATLQSISEIFSFTTERVRQLLKSSYKKVAELSADY